MAVYSAGLYSDNIELKLDNIKALCAALENPQNRLKFIHIAGTNGKGSVCSFLESIFFEAGYTVGKFSSPDVTDAHDSISVNKQYITETELLELYDEINSKNISASDFERLTVCAFLHFIKKNCDIVILETGLGGAGDATNIIPTPLYSIITKISLDHTNFLGNTIEEIASKKAGIIKNSGKTITLSQNPAAMKILKKKCSIEQNELTVIDLPEILAPDFIFENIKYKDYLYSISLGGIHQAENAALAIEAALGLNISEDIIKSGLKKAVHPARFELLSEEPIVLFDGAHNEDGFLALINSLERYFKGKKKSFIIGMMKDKDISKVISLISNVDCEVYTVTVPKNPRAMSCSALKHIFEKNGIPATQINNIQNIRDVISDNINVICGSLYMYSEVSKLFKT